MRRVGLTAQDIDDLQAGHSINVEDDSGYELMLDADGGHRPATTVVTHEAAIAERFPADDAHVRWLLSMPMGAGTVFYADDPDHPYEDEVSSDTRSPWMWVRLANGDLLLATYPQGGTYERLERAVERDQKAAIDSGFHEYIHGGE